MTTNVDTDTCQIHSSSWQEPWTFSPIFLAASGPRTEAQGCVTFHEGAQERNKKIKYVPVRDLTQLDMGRVKDQRCHAKLHPNNFFSLVLSFPLNCCSVGSLFFGRENSDESPEGNPTGHDFLQGLLPNCEVWESCARVCEVIPRGLSDVSRLIFCPLGIQLPWAIYSVPFGCVLLFTSEVRTPMYIRSVL
jgi:hypothetical protein